jgi:hypothetical protein
MWEMHILRLWFGILHYALGSPSSEINGNLAYGCFCLRQSEARVVIGTVSGSIKRPSSVKVCMLSFSNELHRLILF